MQPHELQQSAARTGARLLARSLRLATAESCTGGWIAKVVTDIAGASDWFDRGWVTYSNEAKEELLDVPPELIQAHGVVSQPVVMRMVNGALRHSHAQVAVAVSGIAGPGGGTPDKPVGTVCIAWGYRGIRWSDRCHFDGDREAIRLQTVARALEGVRQVIDYCE